jgi:hypothetical protein
MSDRKTVEVMLSELSVSGIALLPDVKVDMLMAEWSREQIESDGFELLLCVMGHDEEPLSDDVWHFDTEAIYGDGDYVRIAETCRRMSHGELVFDGVADHADIARKEAWLELLTDGKARRLQLRVDDDWVDPKVFDVLDRHLEACGSSRRFWMHVLAQDVLLICQTAEQKLKIEKVTGLPFEKARL